MNIIKFWKVVLLLEQLTLTVNAFHSGIIPKLRRLSIAANDNSKGSVETKYMDQLVDNFDPVNTATWKQRYFCNRQWHKENGPFFVYLTGEEAIYPAAIQEGGGSYIDLCKKVNCIICAPELRFFGQSFPINDTTVDSLRFLNNFQSLDDYATFIKNYKIQNGLTKNKVLVVGGSYSGMQAALMRAKYPFLVDMAWASSGPLDDIFDYPGYFETIGDVIKNISQTCYDQVNEAFYDLEKMLWTCHCALTSKNCELAERNYQPPLSPFTCANNIRKFMSNKFQLCDPFDVKNEGDIRNFFQYVAQSFFGPVQYDSFWPGVGRGNYTIENLCKSIFEDPNSNKTKIEKLSEFNGMANNLWGFPCTDYTEKRFCDQLSETGTYVNITAGSFDGNRQWWWLICSQISYLQTTDSLNQPFGRSFPASFLVQQCQCVFGESVTADYIKAQVETQLLYSGGLKGTRSSTRVIFVNGSYDPWHRPGVLYQNQTSCGNKVIYLQGTSHCADLDGNFTSDPPQLTAAREEIHEQFIEWIGEEEHCCE